MMHTITDFGILTGALAFVIIFSMLLQLLVLNRLRKRYFMNALASAGTTSLITLIIAPNKKLAALGSAVGILVYLVIITIIYFFGEWDFDDHS